MKIRHFKLTIQLIIPDIVYLEIIQSLLFSEFRNKFQIPIHR